MAAQAQVLRPSSETFYRPELDTLRFFAFLAVFVCHTLPGSEPFYMQRGVPAVVGGVLAAISRAGSFGVDLFFLLSAYLITTLLLRERQRTGAIHLRRFYLRRILRIWPLYFLALGIVVLWARFQPSVYMPRAYLLAYVFLAGNWMTVLYGPPPSFMSILWSVSVEEQFYLAWPLGLRHLSRRAIVVVVFALLLVASATRWYVSHHTQHDYAIWPNTLARLDPLALGMLLAVAFPTPPKLASAQRAVWFTLGTVFLIVCGHFFSTSVRYSMFGYPVVAIASAVLLVSILGSRSSHPIPVYLGKISYGLYVFHVLALYISAQIYAGRTHMPQWFALHCATAFFLSVLLATISYRFWETPFLRLKERFTYVKSRPV